MKIIVEIGTEEQRAQIHQELSVIKLITDHLSPPPAISKIIVPANFDATVNSLQETTDYRSERGTLAIAKNVHQENGVALVFSPLIYTDAHDNHTRLQIYSHEVFHVLSKTLFPQVPRESQADFIYFNNIHTLFDEYYANRKSYEVTERVFEPMSHRYKKANALHLKGFLRSVAGDCEYYKKMQAEILKFRYHGNVDLFLKNIDNSFDSAAKSLVYIWSHFDHNPKTRRLEPLLRKCPFWRDNTNFLMDYFKEKYEVNDFELFGARELIEEFMINFGLRFEDMENGELYCHVLDI